MRIAVVVRSVDVKLIIQFIFIFIPMKTHVIKISVSDKLGEVSGEIYEPEKAKALMTLAHGAGAGMSHPFLTKLSSELASAGIATLRFNLHYMEHGKKRPDMPPVAHSVIQAAIEKCRALYPELPLICSGKSFGGRMTSQLLAKAEMKGVKALIFYGFPLHPINNPGVERAEHLSKVNVPMLFLQGTKDSLAEISLVETVVKDLPNATLSIIENADHSFKIGKKDSIVDLSKKTENWLSSLNIL
jgi:uncharacterized protein